MKRCYWMAVGLLIVVAAGLFAAACGSEAEETTTTIPNTTTTASVTGIQGKAYYAGTNEPISGATVRLGDSADGEQASNLTTAETTTDADGNYSFTNIIPGTYEVGFLLTTPTGVSAIDCTLNTSNMLNSFQGVSEDGSTYLNALFPVVEVLSGNMIQEDFIVHP